MPLQALADAIQDPKAATYIRDADGKIIFANDRFQQGTGMTRERLLGHTVAEIFGTKGDAASWQNVDALVYATQSPIVTVEHRAGSAFVVLKTLVTGHDGKTYLLASGVPADDEMTVEQETRVAHLEIRLLNYISSENVTRLQAGIPSSPFNRLSVTEQEPIVAAVDRLTNRSAETTEQVRVQAASQTRFLHNIYRMAIFVSVVIAVDTVAGFFFR